MNEFQFAALILAVTGPVLAASGHFQAPASIVLFAIGVASAFVPGLPRTHLDPDLALTLFLPPLIYASTIRISWHLLRFTFVAGVLLGAAQVLVTVGAVFIALQLLLPGQSWTAALFIGVMATIFDTQLFHEAKGRPRVPRAIADVLKTRELVSRLFILGTLTLAKETLNAGELGLTSIALNYLFDFLPGFCSAMWWAKRSSGCAAASIRPQSRSPSPFRPPSLLRSWLTSSAYLVLPRSPSRRW